MAVELDEKDLDRVAGGVSNEDKYWDEKSRKAVILKGKRTMQNEGLTQKDEKPASVERKVGKIFSN